MVDFLKTDITMGLNFAEAARVTLDPQNQFRLCGNARSTYDTILTLIDKVALTEDDAREVESKLHRLRSELTELGEIL